MNLPYAKNKDHRQALDIRSSRALVPVRGLCGRVKRDRDEMNPSQLSPLDQIRQAEAENIRKIAAAREAAEQIVLKARMDAARLKEQAVEEGRREGQARNREILLKGEEEARALISRAHSMAEKLRRNGEARMDYAVRSAVNLVIGQEGEG